MTTPSLAPSVPRPTPPGRIAGIDFGLVRIGVALTDPDRTLASPFESYNCRGPKHDAEWFRRFASEEDVRLFVVGLPLHLDGRESPKSGQARRFGAWLHEVTGIPVEFHDERFSSVEAERILLDANLTSSRRKRRRDMLAAHIILTAYLESMSQPGAD